MSEVQVILIPGTLALLSEYAGTHDPIPELRQAVGSAFEWLGQEATQAIHVVCVDATPANIARGADLPPAARIVKELAAQHFPAELPPGDEESLVSIIVVGSGSATRHEKAPGAFDPRAEEFDAAIERGLRKADPVALMGIDPSLAEELWMYDASTFYRLGEIFATHRVSGRLTYSADSYGVQYWVGCWRAIAD